MSAAGQSKAYSVLISIFLDLKQPYIYRNFMTQTRFKNKTACLTTVT